MKAVTALYEAQKIAFSPFVFQAAYTMLELNILDEINKTKEITVAEIAANLNLTAYGILVLTEMGVAAEILEKTEDGKLSLSKIGYFLLRDDMTKINLRFTQDINYQGLFFLKDAILNGKPEGLKMLGEWSTIYEGLSILPAKEKKSWFDFDHFYSDNSFDEALKIIFKDHPKQIFDIGGNTGKWAIASTKHDPAVNVKILDLPVQIRAAKENIATNYPEIADRVAFHPIDLLDPTSEIPAGADVYWMSQFLDCFSEPEIEAILWKIRKNAKPGATVYIMETFIDNQRFKAAEFSLIATSLYFTVMANGNSKMYSSTAMKYIISKAGFDCVDEFSIHGDSFHTILKCRLKA